MKDINTYTFTGRLGKDPIITNEVANFSLAIDQSYTKDNHKEEVTLWLNVVAFKPISNAVADNLKKGNAIFGQGHLSTNKWTDKDGNARITTEVILDSFRLLA